MKTKFLVLALLLMSWSVEAQITYVDLGLSVMWGSCNIGAGSPENYGDYLAWGETATKPVYDLPTYFDAQDGGTSYKKYYNYGGATMLDDNDDVAIAHLKGNWRMPSADEWDELVRECTWTETTRNGVSGYEVSRNGNSIFLPFAGSSEGGVGSNGYYWTSRLDGTRSDYAQLGHIRTSSQEVTGHERYRGCSVRPVYDGAVPTDIQISVEAGRWYFIAFPVAVANSLVSYSGTAEWGRYNSAKRAGGVSGWETFVPSATVGFEANTGYIFRGSSNGILTIAIDPTSLPTYGVSITLKQQSSFAPENSNWNFVGNPYPNSFDVFHLTPAGTVVYIWNESVQKYDEYTSGTDHYYLNNFEGFFIQGSGAVSF